MASPRSYSPDYSFSGFQANSPTTPLPATQVDNEFANISEAITDHADAINDVRRADGALKNNIVTYDSLSKSLQLTFDPTNGDAVAAAIAVAQAAAAAASGSATAASGSATSAANSAAAAAASASSVNLALYLSKAGNLDGIGNADTARGNISGMKVDASDATGRLAKTAAVALTDFNSAIDNGYYASGPGAANAPDATNYWLVHVLTAGVAQVYVTQTAYLFVAAGVSADSVLIYRRHAYDNAGSRAWTPWISNSAVPVGAVMSFATTAAPPGYLKLNGALLTRASYPALWAHANASGNVVTEASWSGGNTGAFSSGDLSTTFRLPDGRGEFFRAYDDSRGVDSGRVLGSRQSDLLKDHTHNQEINASAPNVTGGGNFALNVNSGTAATGGVNGGLGGSETRPRNIALLACIKF
ncbi:tail fiber protein [Bradyrhizobium liaoningense]|uniref:phage tail protein n=1 Tax=Bradyrhizobium liaoningense TaxID=43992 RepID=UPI001BA58D6C|nr:phage tail protein [Bradyrhizobium liaoningense]MBR0741239.1 tail fiber protein [Bradyrhizobium liaoningense]